VSRSRRSPSSVDLRRSPRSVQRYLRCFVMVALEVLAAGQACAMPLMYLVQHGDKERAPGDPGLTAAGRQQAAMAGQWLRSVGVRSLYSSPLRRARQTAMGIASVTGLEVVMDARLCERLNWSRGSFADFAAEWSRSERDRDFVPAGGDSSRQAGERLRAFVIERSGLPGPVAAVTHGGVTRDLLRTLLGDDDARVQQLGEDIPACAITTLDDLEVTDIALVRHLM
jgi:broad specificity phosphatase PhoE